MALPVYPSPWCVFAFFASDPNDPETQDISYLLSRQYYVQTGQSVYLLLTSDPTPQSAALFASSDDAEDARAWLDKQLNRNPAGSGFYVTAVGVMAGPLAASQPGGNNAWPLWTKEVV